MAQTVVVTGATGFVATELVKQLLEKGYSVIGTVRDTNSKRVQILNKLGDALPGTLILYEADLTKEGSFDKAVERSQIVFHTASPFVIHSDDPQRKILDLAVKGTANVLNSVAKFQSTVEKVVLTSSVAAVHGEYGASPKNGKLYTEYDFNETSSIENGQAYHKSKVLAERLAWQMAKQNGFKLISICPNFVLGPILSPEADSLSVGFIKSILEGGKIEGSPIICDVRDVGRAHILAAESPTASGRWTVAPKDLCNSWLHEVGTRMKIVDLSIDFFFCRYIVSERRPITAEFVSSLLKKRFQDLHIQDSSNTAQKSEDKIDNSKAEKELGLFLRSPASTLIDMAVTALQLGIAKP